MLGRKKVLAVLAARGGSKGLPGKNVAPCAGKPLIAWSVEAALASKTVDRAVVSSDDAEILAVARAHGADVPFVRPAELATDGATMDGVVLHALDAVGESYDVGVLLQATSPMRTAADIDGALAEMDRTGSPSVASVTEPTKSPFWMYRVGDDGRLVSLFPDVVESPKRRQELPRSYVLNGAVFAFDVAWFRTRRKFTCEETVPYVMPQERSIDVDTALDLALADLLLRAGRPVV